MKTYEQHAATRWTKLKDAGLVVDVGGPKGAYLKDVATALLTAGYYPSTVLDIIIVLNAHDELVAAAQNARNVLAALVTGDLKEVKADSHALVMLRAALAKAGVRS